MMYAAHIHAYVQHTSMRLFNRTHTYIYMCVCVCVCVYSKIHQYVSSTAQILVYVRPTRQFASVKPHIYMCMSNIPACQYNCTYTPMCTSNTPVCVS